MAQPSPTAYRGPFLGLDTTRSPRELSPAYAVEANNVLLSEGRIRPRSPFVDYFSEAGVSTEWPGGSSIETPRAVSVFHFTSNSKPPVLVVKLIDTTYNDRDRSTPAEWWAVPISGAPTFLTDTDSLGIASFTVVNGKLFIVDGGSRLLVSDGTPGGTYWGGIYAPRFVGQISAIYGSDGLYGGLENHKYRYATTWYNPGRDLESNPVYSGVTALVAPPDTEGGYAGTRVAIPIAVLPGTTFWRIYRQDVTLNQPFYRLVGEQPIEEASFDDFGVRLDGTEPVLSDIYNGPFAPSKNGVPERFSCATYYKDRMYYGASGDDPTSLVPVRSLRVSGDILAFSTYGRPEYVDSSDYLTLQGDVSPGVTGMAEMADQLIILKHKSIWLLAGDVKTTDNADIALGVEPPPSTHNLYKTKSLVGCSNRSGNGAIVCGNPPMVHFNSESGFYRFNGIDEAMLTSRIKPTWRETIDAKRSGDSAQNVTYAVDPYNEVLYICNSDPSILMDDATTTPGEALILVYHYGLQGQNGIGAWTTLDLTDVADPTDVATCVASSLGERLEPHSTGGSYVELIIGTRFASLYRTEERKPLPSPAMRYVTGTMPINEGLGEHLFSMKWLHLNTPDSYKDALGDTTSNVLRQMGFGFRVGNDTQDTMVKRVLTGKTYSRQPIRRTAAEIQLVITDAGDPGAIWSRDMGVVGWMIETERAGEQGG